FTVPMSPEIHEIVKKGMWGAVHDGAGTAGGARIDGFDVCGKTGTAQGGSWGKAGEKSNGRARVVTFARRDKTGICSVVLAGNAGFGGRQSAPRAKAIYEDYYRRTRGITDKPEETKAENSGPGDATQSPGSKTGVRAPEPKPQTPGSGAKGQR